MGRIKDKEKLKKEFQKSLNTFLTYERFEYVYLNDEKTNFMISTKGRIFSLNYNKTGKIKELKVCLNADGHKEVTLKFKGVDYNRRIHRLVALAFMPNPDNKPHVHHKDGDSLNNDIENLMWVTQEEHEILTVLLNQYDKRYGENNPVTKYTDEQIHHVCKLLSDNKLCMKDIEKETGVAYYVIQLIRYKKCYREIITSQYDFSNYNVFNDYKYTDEQIHHVCKLLEMKKFTDNEISNLTSVSYSMVKSIRLKKRRIEISKDYNF